MKQKTVLILANSSAGLYDFRNELVVRLLQEYRVVVSLPDEVCAPELLEEGCEIVQTPINRRGSNPLQDGKLIRTYRGLIKKYQPALVLTYTIKPNIYGGMAAASLKVPYIATVTGLGSAFEKSGLFLDFVKTLYRVGLRKANCVFFQNRENLELFHSNNLVSGRDRLVMGSGVNLEKWKPMAYPEGDVTRFLYVGRVMREKGIEEFLRAADVLHGEKVQFLIAGYSDEDWQETLDTKEKEGCIKLLGFHKDMHELYEKCSAVVLPTYHEGMSNALMEASACARPVIATNISGCREIFEEGVTGFGFAPKSAEGLIAALRRFLIQPLSSRAAMGMSARDKMEREFDRQKVADVYMEEVHRATNS